MTTVSSAGILYNSTEWGMRFVNNVSAVSYSLVPTAQYSYVGGDNGRGPIYLLNGLTNKGYWFQLGVGYNNGTGYYITYAIYPPNNPSYTLKNGTVNLTSQIHPGDTVILQMQVKSNRVYLYAADLNSHGVFYYNYTANNATTFVGQPTSRTFFFFTGIMTEWWHNASYFQPQYRVTYTPYTLQQRTPVWLFLYGNFAQGAYQNESVAPVPAYISTPVSILGPNASVTYQNGSLITGTLAPTTFTTTSTTSSTTFASTTSTITFTTTSLQSSISSTSYSTTSIFTVPSNGNGILAPVAIIVAIAVAIAAYYLYAKARTRRKHGRRSRMIPR